MLDAAHRKGVGAMVSAGPIGSTFWAYISRSAQYLKVGPNAKRTRGSGDGRGQSRSRVTYSASSRIHQDLKQSRAFFNPVNPDIGEGFTSTSTRKGLYSYPKSSPQKVDLSCPDGPLWRICRSKLWISGGTLKWLSRLGDGDFRARQRILKTGSRCQSLKPGIKCGWSIGKHYSRTCISLV